MRIAIVALMSLVLASPAVAEDKPNKKPAEAKKAKEPAAPIDLNTLFATKDKPNAEPNQT